MPTSICPTAGQLLGHAVQAFRLDETSVGGSASAFLSDKTADRFFKGKWVPDNTRNEICNWVAAAAIYSGLISINVSEKALPGSPTGEQLLGLALQQILQTWDSTFHFAVSRWPHPHPQLMGFALGRQIVIDLVWRVTALAALAESGMDFDNAASWLQPDGGRTILEIWLKRYGPERSLDSWADVFEIDERTLDRWLSRDSPQIPSDNSLGMIAKAFAANAGEQETKILRQLRLAYGLHALWRTLASGIGVQFATDLGDFLIRRVHANIALFSSAQGQSDHFLRQARNLVNGLSIETASATGEWLRHEDNSLWRDDVLAASRGLVSERLTGCLRIAGDWPATAQLQREACGKFLEMESPAKQNELMMRIALWCMNDNLLNPELVQRIQTGEMKVLKFTGDDEFKARNRAIQAEALINQGDHAGALPHWARAVELQPHNELYRFFLGTCLWQAGRWEDAVDQLLESSRLKPEWDKPFVEVAIVYLNRARAGHARPISEQASPSGLVVCRETPWEELALHHLQQGRARFECNSAWFNHKLGLALSMLRNFPKALEALNAATELDPKMGEAWDLAAECAFQSGDKVKGRRYAKEALHRGCRTSHDRWQV
ncbi:MAG TPA: tetratricopeptide repeat protein [Phycisphaerae bacterium]|nr:tetratricopeptide repeat protein [Phycisphaerae bacterium]